MIINKIGRPASPCLYERHNILNLSTEFGDTHRVDFPRYQFGQAVGWVGALKAGSTNRFREKAHTFLVSWQFPSQILIFFEFGTRQEWSFEWRHFGCVWINALTLVRKVTHPHWLTQAICTTCFLFLNSTKGRSHFLIIWRDFQRKYASERWRGSIFVRNKFSYTPAWDWKEVAARALGINQPNKVNEHIHLQVHLTEISHFKKIGRGFLEIFSDLVED